tara:strand:+ start:170 stop:541 length:372 start_codon:yes stop_codon:yes gene_type:complete
MCNIIDDSVNLLTLNTTAHLLAADYYYSRYCLIAILSIAISAIVAVWGRILPSEMVGTGTHANHDRPPPTPTNASAAKPAPRASQTSPARRGSLSGLQRLEHPPARPDGPHALRDQVHAARAG